MDQRPSVSTPDDRDHKQRTWAYYFTLNRKLLPLKIFMFFYYGGFIALYPYLTIHMKSIGITAAQTGIIYSVYPICVCLGGPLSGMIADKTGQYKFTLIGFISLSVVLHMGLYFIPAYSVQNVQTQIQLSKLEMTTFCAPTETESYTEVTFSLPDATSLDSCDPLQLFRSNSTDLRFQNCFLTNCEDPPKFCQKYSGGKMCHENLILGQTIPAGSLVFKDSNMTSPNTKTVDWTTNRNMYCESMHLNCRISCEAVLSPEKSLSCSEVKIHGNQFTTFFLYAFNRLAAGFAINLAFTLVDASLIQMVADFDGDIGINRAFGSVGFCVVPPFSGLLIDYVSRSNKDGAIDYRPAFYMFAAGLICSIIVLLFSRIDARVPATNIWGNAIKLLKYKRVIAFLVIFFFIGTAWGFLESFLFWFLDEDLKVQKWLLGFTNTVGGVSGIPFAFCMTWIVSKTGYTKLFLFGLFMFGVRFIGYSFVYHPFAILPLEALEALTCTLPLIAASMYAAGFSGDLLATLQGVVSAVHFGFGRGIGSVIGGFMISSMGTRKSFQIFGIFCIAYSIFHTILHYTYLRYLPKAQSNQKASPETGDLLKSSEKEKMEESGDAEDYPASNGQFLTPPMINPTDPESCGSFVGLNQIGHTTEGPNPDDNILLHRRRRSIKT